MASSVCTCGHAQALHDSPQYLTPAGPICTNANRCGCLGFDPADDSPRQQVKARTTIERLAEQDPVGKLWDPADNLDPNACRRAIALQSAYAQLLQNTEGAWRDGTEDTPGRAARAWVELTSGYDVDISGLMTLFPADAYDELVIVRSCPVWSLCEHHLLPFHGVAHVGYIPGNSIIGLSKIPRIVDAYARRLQVQERLTAQIADTLSEYLKPKGVIVVVEATHLCMAMRGVAVQNSTTTTSAVRGVLKEKPEARAEALNLIGART